MKVFPVYYELEKEHALEKKKLKYCPVVVSIYSIFINVTK
jgi:hypothetical protein